MDRKEIHKHVDHTLLAQTATWEEIKADFVMMQSVMELHPYVFLRVMVKQVKEYVQDRIVVCYGD